MVCHGTDSVKSVPADSPGTSPPEPRSAFAEDQEAPAHSPSADLGVMPRSCPSVNQEAVSNVASTSSRPKHEPATMIQAAFRGHATRRALKGLTLSGGPLKLVAQKSMTRGYTAHARPWKGPPGEPPLSSCPAAQRWQRIRRRLVPLINARGLLLKQEHWLEVVDRKHRYGTHLRVYHEYWLSLGTAETQEPFFSWLDEGSGVGVDLPECPRAKLEQDRVKYCTPEEAQHLQVMVVEGLLRYVLTGELVETREAGADEAGIDCCLPPRAAHPDAPRAAPSLQQALSGIDCRSAPSHWDDAALPQAGAGSRPVEAAAGGAAEAAPQPPKYQVVYAPRGSGAPAPSADEGVAKRRALRKALSDGTDGGAGDDRPPARMASLLDPRHDPKRLDVRSLMGTVPAGVDMAGRLTLQEAIEAAQTCGKPKDTFIYVMDTQKRLYIARKVRGHFHHSSFLRGVPLIAAGGIRVHGGQLVRITAMSGHYKPKQEDIDALVDALADSGIDTSCVTVLRQVKQEKGPKTHYLGKAAARVEAGSDDMPKGKDVHMQPGWVGAEREPAAGSGDKTGQTHS